MMSFDFGQLIFSILWLLTIVTIILIKKEDRVFYERICYIVALMKLEDYAMIVVKYVKDMGDETKMPGAGKRMLAAQALLDFRDKLKLDVTHEQIEMMVRAAYMTIKKDQETKDEKEKSNGEQESFDVGVLSLFNTEEIIGKTGESS